MKKKISTPRKLVSQAQVGYLFAHQKEMSAKERKQLHNKVRGKKISSLPKKKK